MYIHIHTYTGATFGYAYPERDTGVPRTATGFRQGICNGSEPRLIDCPQQVDYKKCVDGVMLSCQLGKHRLMNYYYEK